MAILRWVFVAACLGCVIIVAWKARWEGRLTQANDTWIVDLGLSAVWAPPPKPPYAKFKEVYKELDGFPAEGLAGMTIQRVLKVDWMAVDLLLCLWVVTAISGLLYLVGRGEQRDLILHVGLSSGISLTAAAAACVGLWLLFGGWGPPAPGFFGSLGLVLGVIVGLASFQRDLADPGDASDRGGNY